MNEINNPDKSIESPKLEQSPAERQAFENKNTELGNKLDNMTSTKSPEEPKKDISDIEKHPEFAGQQDSFETKNAEAGERLDSLSSSGDSEKKQVEPNETDKPEIQGKFCAENFRAEDSHNAHASDAERELHAKNAMDLQPMGVKEEDVVREPKSVYTQDEVKTLNAEREKIDNPDESTVMQKVVGVDSGDIQKDLDGYLNPVDRDSKEPVPASVYGFVSKAEDSAPFTNTPQECHDNLRLDYERTQYKDPDQSVYVLRYTDGTNYEVPRSPEFGGERTDATPFAGNGYIASESLVIPEYTVVPEDQHGALITDGEIYRINPGGKEELVAAFNKKDKNFELIS